MSLMRIVARIALVRALRGKTLVGDNVLDSEIGALRVNKDGSLTSSQRKRFIAVYTEGSRVAAAGVGEMFGNGETEFICEVGVLDTHFDIDKETGETLITEGIPVTGATLEFYLDLIMRQVAEAISDPGNQWAECFKRCVNNWSLQRARTNGDGSGAKAAAHQLSLTGRLINDPSPGATLDPQHALNLFFELAAAACDAELSKLVEMMQAQLACNLSELHVLMARYGFTQPEAEGLLFAPVVEREGDGGEFVVVPNPDDD